MDKAIVERLSESWWVTYRQRGQAFCELVGPATLTLDQACHEAEKIIGQYLGQWQHGRDWALFTPATLPPVDQVEMSPEAKAYLKDQQAVFLDPPKAIDADWEPVPAGDWLWNCIIAASLVYIAVAVTVLAYFG
jgi:hypothetical protein